jgi:hypothetical protein
MLLYYAKEVDRTATEVARLRDRARLLEVDWRTYGPDTLLRVLANHLANCTR